MASVARILLHSFAAASMIYGYQRLKGLPIDAVISAQYGGHLQYLTIQGLFLACFTTLTSLVIDLFPSTNFLKPLKRTLLIVSLPVSIVISTIYWTLIIFATHLILQNDGEPSSSSDIPQFTRLPLHMDLCLHAVPAISLLVDFMLFEKKYSWNELVYGAPAVSSVYTILYAWWVERCASFNGKFPYPFLDNSLEIRVAIYIGAGALALSSFWFINRLHS
ncbi:FAR-17a/AIG1-like protein [Rhodocollybia butyracea]|uniref:FAR-17a/AIG1-like protein n=1 Tax=Rhodocollybia butyracea TaxID=206335 RepID=A0A9P5U8G3_9AGAR|nr:FAR-17a/AIG1-like protein [Rhodocollybia butyracea]